jgi:hypothetical protein
VLEQSEVFPAASVAVAQNVVVVFADTVTPIPGDANVESLPLPATAELHAESVYSSTVDPDSAPPTIFGLAFDEGDTGLELVTLGATGAMSSCV